MVLYHQSTALALYVQHVETDTGTWFERCHTAVLHCYDRPIESCSYWLLNTVANIGSVRAFIFGTHFSKRIWRPFEGLRNGPIQCVRVVAWVLGQDTGRVASYCPDRTEGNKRLLEACLTGTRCASCTTTKCDSVLMTRLIFELLCEAY